MTSITYCYSDYNKSYPIDIPRKFKQCYRSIPIIIICATEQQKKRIKKDPLNKLSVVYGYWELNDVLNIKDKAVPGYPLSFFRTVLVIDIDRMDIKQKPEIKELEKYLELYKS